MQRAGDEVNAKKAGDKIPGAELFQLISFSGTAPATATWTAGSGCSPGPGLLKILCTDLTPVL